MEKATMNNFDKYILTTMRAQKRYYGKEENKGLVLYRGGIASKYTKIENMAYKKYIQKIKEM